ncbi:MAG: sulfatase-like hydrolase/transferase [Ruthenibacterium sp.]
MNVLLVFSDQQNPMALGRRNAQYITPHLDQLCEEGVLFENGYSANPVCGPYRGCLMTGQFTSHCKVFCNNDPLCADAYSLASAMKDAGYATSYVGKWHLGATGNIPVAQEYRKGFTRFMGYQCYNGFNPAAPYYNDVKFFNQDDKCFSLPLHRTDATTALAVEELRLLAQAEKPFFLAVSYQAPHYPEQPAAEYAKLYTDTVFQMREDYLPTDPYTPTKSPASKTPVETCPDYQNYGGNMQQYLRLYAGLCTQIDAGVGKLTQTLKALNLYDDTMIIYTSDHGDMQGSRGLKNKCHPYELSCGVPFIVRYPNGRCGEQSKELVSCVDVYPTLLELANADAKSALDGVSLLPYLKGNSEKTQDFVIAEHTSTQQWRMIRTARFKLIVSLSYEPKELYDLCDDSLEQKNLKDCEQYQAQIKHMLAILKKKTGIISASPQTEFTNS